MIIWVASYPKSGNTWLRAFLANLSNLGDEPANINELGLGNFDDRPRFDALVGWETSEMTRTEVDRLRVVAQESLDPADTYFYKVHEAFTHPHTREPLISVKASQGAIYIVRNPLDVAVSLANHFGQGLDFAVQFMETAGANLQLNSQLPQPMGTWSWHVESWTKAPGLRTLVIRYEDMLLNPMEVFTSASRFAGLPDDEELVSRAVANSSFDVLSRQEQTHGFKEAPGQGRRFFRKGVAGDWREALSPEQVERIVGAHSAMMKKFGYLGDDGRPV